MQFRFTVRLMALVVALVVLTPTALLLGSPKPGGHSCCATNEGYRLPAQPARCCIVSAPPETQTLGPVVTSVSVTPVAHHTTPPLSQADSATVVHPCTVSPSPPPCSSVLRI